MKLFDWFLVFITVIFWGWNCITMYVMASNPILLKHGSFKPGFYHNFFIGLACVGAIIYRHS